MSNIDEHFNKVEKKAKINTGDYAKKQGYTSKVSEFIEQFDAIIPFIIEEYDDLMERLKTKPCKAFDEKTDGLAALKEFHDSAYFQDMKYWYVDEPKLRVQ